MSLGDPRLMEADVAVSDNLGKGGYLILTFNDQDIEGYKMYSDYYPVVWR